MTNLDKFRRGKLDLTPVGLAPGEKRGGYFCTPIGMTVLAWTGVDGIHYGTIRDQGEKIFVVCPMNTPGDYVHPVAANFDDFLRLLLTLGSEARICDIGGRTAEEFAALMAKEEPNPALMTLAENTGLTPMTDAYAYVRGIQDTFAYRSLRFSKEYKEWAPEEPRVPAAPAWEVRFEGGFFSTSRKSRPGEMLECLKAVIQWAGEEWRIPAVYLCGKGIVVDICAAIHRQKVADYIEKLRAREALGTPMTEDEDEEFTRANPTNIDFRAVLQMNGETLTMAGMSGCTHIPPSLTGGEVDREAGWIAEHYGLDPETVWTFCRVRFPWPKGRKRAVDSLSIRLTPRPEARIAAHFSGNVGTVVPFRHPGTGVEHTLTIREIAPTVREMSHSEMELPTHTTRMLYTIEPDIPTREFRVEDVRHSDEPRMLATPSGNTGFTSVIGIIGGADGPTAVFVANHGEAEPTGMHIAYSSLHFEPPKSVEWRIRCMVMTREAVEISLI